MNYPPVQNQFVFPKTTASFALSQAMLILELQRRVCKMPNPAKNMFGNLNEFFFQRMEAMKTTGKLFLGAALAIGLVTAARADEVIFKNGDHLSGKIESAADGKLVITTAMAGKITVDLKN